ncbi:uncharacterized protein LOC134283468 [Saccostrea cucullata]|uniref:uncharacterized protein LOC134283468 n=1 Tax=Saccostrea cuccullata TaxID=36930 RepID=UPI002ED2E806
MLNESQQRALQQVEMGHNIYIGGQAGVGKSYLVKSIINAARSKGKKVALTCTTGIACSVYDKLSSYNVIKYLQSMGAMTIHKWSGLGGGRFSGGKLKMLLQHDEAYVAAKENFLGTDWLIVDEISMFSAQMLDKLDVVCSIRSDKAPFGGIQVIFVWDFTQLPPVRHLRYGDVGSFCFESKRWPQHSIFLTENMRQKESKLCKVVNALSLGRLDDEILNYMSCLSRPLHETPETIKLFSNNVLVDMFNRDKILNHKGGLFCFDAVDEGSKGELDKLHQDSCG